MSTWPARLPKKPACGAIFAMTVALHSLESSSVEPVGAHWSPARLMASVAAAAAGLTIRRFVPSGRVLQ